MSNFYACINVGRNPLFPQSTRPPRIGLDPSHNLVRGTPITQNRTPGGKVWFTNTIKQAAMNESSSQPRCADRIDPGTRRFLPLHKSLILPIPDGWRKWRISVVADCRHKWSVFSIRNPSQSTYRIFRHANVILQPEEPIRLSANGLLHVQHRADGIQAGIRERHSLMYRDNPAVVLVVHGHLCNQNSMRIIRPRINTLKTRCGKDDNLFVWVGRWRFWNAAEWRLVICQNTLDARLCHKLPRREVRHQVSPYNPQRRGTHTIPLRRVLGLKKHDRCSRMQARHARSSGRQRMAHDSPVRAGG